MGSGRDIPKLGSRKRRALVIVALAIVLVIVGVSAVRSWHNRSKLDPMRLDLLELLATMSPATAAQCARILGVPQANCSFHLRQLAKYGFVEDAGPGDDRRWIVRTAGPATRRGTAARTGRSRAPPPQRQRAR